LFFLFVLVFLFEWSITIPEALDSQGRLRIHVPRALGIAVGWAPAIAAIIVVVFTRGKAGLRALFGRFLIARVNLAWYIVALFGPAALMLAGIGLYVATGGRVHIPAAKAPLTTVVFAFVVTVLAGALINTEEIAWRGVALDRLQTTRSALVASLIVAVPEGLSHLPLFFNKNIAFFQNVGFTAFMLFTCALAVIYTWLFNNTRGSLLLVTLMHASQNAWANLLSDDQSAPFYWTVGVLIIAAIIVVAVCGPQRLLARASDRRPQDV
jgi:membrane protease YdiL (CAAX protease family)